MNATIQIYNIDKQIEDIFNCEDSYNLETGEMLPEAEQAINGLALGKEQVIHSVAMVNIQGSAVVDMIDTEIKRLQALKQSAESKVNTAKRLLSKMIPQGEKVEFADVKISWRKSTEVLTDEFIDLEDLEKTYPDLVRVKRELSKSAAKELHKNTGMLPSGISIITKQNLQVK